MSYYEKLNEYMQSIPCTSKELALHSGLSISLISKYRNGSRSPKVDSQNFYKVITGLKDLAQRKDVTLDANALVQELSMELNPYQLDYSICQNNFNRIIDILRIHTSSLANYMQMDSSFLYRIRSGSRKPFNITQFFDSFIQYLITYYGQDKAYLLNNLLEIDATEPLTAEQYNDMLLNYLNQNHEHSTSFMDDFFERLDSFDIQQYSMRFDDKIEQELTEYYYKSLPHYQKKYYTGFEGGKKAELDYLKAVLASPSKEPVFLYNEVSMESEFTDPEFYQKWLFGLSLLLRNEIEINIIHNIYRPAKEMLMGMRSWLPLYMSGAVHSYYFDVKMNSNIKYMHCTSGDRALIGERMDNTEKYIYYYTTKQPELDYYKAKSKFLLEHAKPLMKFYYEDRDYYLFQRFLETEHPYSFPWVEKPEFQNIEFRIKDNEWVMISRITEPKMHFVIYNQQIIHTIRTYLHYY